MTGEPVPSRGKWGGGGAGIKNMLLMVMHLKRLGKDLAAKVR